MTIEDIGRAHNRQVQIRRLLQEIDLLRKNPLQSHTKAITVNGEIQYMTGGGSSLPSSPVEQHFRNLERLEEQLADLNQQQKLFWEMAETIEDDEIRAIIYWRVSKLLTWDQIADKIYRLDVDRKTPYNRLKRWTEKEEE